MEEIAQERRNYIENSYFFLYICFHRRLKDKHLFNNFIRCIDLNYRLSCNLDCLDYIS